MIFKFAAHWHSAGPGVGVASGPNHDRAPAGRRRALALPDPGPAARARAACRPRLRVAVPGQASEPAVTITADHDRHGLVPGGEAQVRRRRWPGPVGPRHCPAAGAAARAAVTTDSECQLT